MLKPEMIEKLNEQMNLELYSSLLYQQMSAWCSYHTFEGAAAFLRRHAQEEMTHMQRLFDYLTDTGNLPRINTVESPFAEYSSLDELFQETYKHEQLITQKINELAHAAMTNQDYPTFNFLQWYVSEQHEEEKLFKSIIDKLSLALMNPLMILVKIIKLRWIHILSYDQMVSRKINNQTTRCANSIFYTTLFTNSAPNYT